MTVTLPGTAQLLLWLVLLLLTVRPLGGYMHRVFSGEATPLFRLPRPVESALYRAAGVRPGQQQEWLHYAMAFFAYHLPGMLLLYLRVRLQDRLPLNPAGQAALGNAGPHGSTEVLYACTSAVNTNGSAFSGLSTNTPFYNLTLASGMAVGRFVVIVPVLASAGSMAAGRRVAVSKHTADDGRADLSPRAGARAGRRASGDAARCDVLRPVWLRPRLASYASGRESCLVVAQIVPATWSSNAQRQDGPDDPGHDVGGLGSPLLTGPQYFRPRGSVDSACSPGQSLAMRNWLVTHPLGTPRHKTPMRWDHAA
jgi:hypothetical protein